MEMCYNYEHKTVVIYLEQQGLESLPGPQIHAIHMYSTLFLVKKLIVITSVSWDIRCKFTANNKLLL